MFILGDLALFLLMVVDFLKYKFANPLKIGKDGDRNEVIKIQKIYN
jgi:hypothetical protein